MDVHISALKQTNDSTVTASQEIIPADRQSSSASTSASTDADSTVAPESSRQSLMPDRKNAAVESKDKRDKRVRKMRADDMDRVALESGLRFPVSQASRALKRGKYSAKVGGSVPVYVSAVLEYLATEVLELAGQVAGNQAVNDQLATQNGLSEGELKRNTITPYHLEYILNKDKELQQVVEIINKGHEDQLGQEDLDSTREGDNVGDVGDDDDSDDGHSDSDHSGGDHSHQPDANMHNNG